MARYNADPTKDTAGFLVLPKGDYRLRFGEPKAFEGETKEGANAGQVNYGIAYVMTVVDGPVDDEGNVSPREHLLKKVYIRLYQHTQESRNFSKNYIMAAFGYSSARESEFNEHLSKVQAENPEDPANDWSYDTETGECGEAWKLLTNRDIVCSLSTKLDAKNREQQNFDSIRPAP